MGSVITAELSFKQSIDLLYALFEDRWEGSTRPKELKPILGRCIKASEKRNQMVHSSWYEPTKTHGIRRIKFRARNQKGLSVQHQVVTPDDIGKIADD